MPTDTAVLDNLPRHLQKTQANVDKLLKEAYPDIYDKDKPLVKINETPSVQVQSPPLAAGSEGQPEVEVLDDLLIDIVKPETPSEKPKDFEQMYKILQGKYNAEVPRLSAEIKSVKQQNQDLQATIESRINQALAAVLTQNKTESIQTATTTSDLLNDPEYMTFQEEYPETAKNLNKIIQVQTENNKKLMEKLGQFENRIKQSDATAQKSEQDRFNDSLAVKVKDWKTIDQDPAFTQWLQEKAPYSNQSKHQLLVDAYNRRDIDTTARFFEDFQKDSKTDQSQSIPPNTPNDELGTETTVEDLISPPRGSSPAPKSNNQFKFITRKQIEKHFKDVEDAMKGKGPYYGQEKKQAVVQKVIDDAQSRRGNYRILD